MRRYLFRVEDGETHWVIASCEGDAVEILSREYDFDPGNYRNDFTPEITMVSPDEYLEVNVGEFVGADRILREFGGRGDLIVKIRVCDAVEMEAGILCSTLW